jgi:hypothetical protein
VPDDEQTRWPTAPPVTWRPRSYARDYDEFQLKPQAGGSLTEVRSWSRCNFDLE